MLKAKSKNVALDLQVGVAVPDTRLEKSSVSHMTLTEDLVIRAIPFALPATVSNAYCLRDILSRTMGHNFISAYMDAKRPAEQAILAATKNSFTALTLFTTQAVRDLSLSR